VHAMLLCMYIVLRKDVVTIQEACDRCVCVFVCVCEERAMLDSPLLRHTSRAWNLARSLGASMMGTPLSYTVSSKGRPGNTHTRPWP